MESRMIREVPIESSSPSLFKFAFVWLSARMQECAISLFETWMVVSAGWMASLSIMSSKPTTDICDGTLTPFVCSARIAPIAVRSFAVITAVGRDVASKELIAASPPTTL